MLTTDVPAAQTFVLHGTVPVPPDTYPRPDGLVPLAVRNPDGSLAPTQLEVVSRYPDASKGAAVVEVIARVDRPAGTAQGEPAQYAVVSSLHAGGPPNIDPEVSTLLNSPGSLVLVANDAMGNRYRLDLLAPVHSPQQGSVMEVQKAGEAVVQLRTHGVMTPVGVNIGAPGGALPHLFGVHAYVTTWAGEKTISLDLRVHNGMSGLDKSKSEDDALKSLYFRSLSLYVRNGWRLMSDVDVPVHGTPYSTSSWTVYPLIAPTGDGSVHYMPQQGMLERRYAVARIGHASVARSLLDREGLGFVRRMTLPGTGELWSWWNDQTANYWPQRHKLPALDHIPAATIESKLAGELWNAIGALQSGNPGSFPIVSPALGWAHPYGVAYGGQTGGSEINLYDGLRVAEIGSRAGYRSTELTARMYGDRMPIQLWNLDGDPVALSDVLKFSGGVGYVPMSFYLTLIGTPDPFGFNQAPTYQISYVQSQGLSPTYEPALAGYYAIDFQHYVRYTRNLKILAWLGNDSMSKDDIEHAAAIFRLSYHEYPKATNGNYQSSGLLSAMKFVANTPGMGFGFGRGESWGLDAAVAAYALGDDHHRSRAKDWLDLVLATVAKGQVPCTGLIQAKKVGGWLGGQWRARSSPEHAVIENALWGLRSSVYLGADTGRAQLTAKVIRSAVYGMIGPTSWAPSHQAPWFLAAVTPLDLSQPAYCTSLPPGGGGNGPDSFQTWSSFAYGYELTGDPVFLQKATAMTWSSNLLAWLENEKLDNAWNWAALMAVLQ